MRTKFPESNGGSILSDVFIKMTGPTSLYRSKAGLYKVWSKGRKVLETWSVHEAEEEYERRCRNV